MGTKTSVSHKIQVETVYTDGATLRAEIDSDFPLRHPIRCIPYSSSRSFWRRFQTPTERKVMIDFCVATTGSLISPGSWFPFNLSLIILGDAEGSYGVSVS